MTLQRKKILAEMANWSNHVSAEALFERLKPDLPDLSLSTVYRNLKSLADSGQVSVSDLGDGMVFELVHEANHHHLICLNCHAVMRLDEDLVTPFFEQIESQGYKLVTRHLCLYGYCPDCQKQN